MGLNTKRKPEKTGLKDCPFCGGKAKLEEIRWGGKVHISVGCETCGAHGLCTCYIPTFDYVPRDRQIAKLYAIDAWNRRHNKLNDRYTITPKGAQYIDKKQNIQ